MEMVDAGLAEFTDPHSDPEELLIQNEDTKELHNLIEDALNTLLPSQRELLYKIRIAGIPETHIAKEEGVSYAAISRRLDRILCKILVNLRIDR